MGLPRLDVVVADSDPILRRGLRSVIEEWLLARVVDARTGSEAAAAVARTRPDVLVLDVRTPPCDRLAVLPALAGVTRVVVLAQAGDPRLVAQAIQQGAVAFLVHGEYTTDELLRAIVEARRGHPHLTASAASVRRTMRDLPPASEPPIDATPRARLSRREAEVMDHIARGLSNPDIAEVLCLSEKTVKNHVNHIFTKLQVRTRAKAIVLWLGGPGDPA